MKKIFFALAAAALFAVSCNKDGGGLLHEDRWFKFLFFSNTRKSYLFLEHFNVMNSMFLSLLQTMKILPSFFWMLVEEF